MTDPQAQDERARAFFDQLWGQGDPWSLETAAYDRQRNDRQFDLLSDRRYERVLEVGCGAGLFSAKLATIADTVVAIDVSAVAIAGAARRDAPVEAVQFRAGNIMEFDVVGEGPWDLVVISETIYYLGWLYSFFEVAWLARQMFLASKPGSRVLMGNTVGGLNKDYLHQEWVLSTYRDLFVNVGYQVERQELFRGTKNGVELDALIVVFSKPLPVTP